LPDESEFPSEGRWPRFLRWLRRRRFRVADASMEPTLRPGDGLYVDPGAYRSRDPKPGEIVVTRDPVLSSRHLVKRVGFVPGGPRPPDGVEVPAGTVYLVGDAPAASRDSREFGAVPLALLVGRAYECYRPPEHRRGL